MSFLAPRPPWERPSFPPKPRIHQPIRRPSGNLLQSLNPFPLKLFLDLLAMGGHPLLHLPLLPHLSTVVGRPGS